MPSRLDSYPTDLRIGDWFTIEDEFDARPEFLRNHDESHFRAVRPSSCPPPGVPMRLIARHDHYLYASAMSWNGQEWCPAIVDLRQHEVVPLPKSVPDAIKGHIERERQKHMPQRPPQQQQQRQQQQSQQSQHAEPKQGATTVTQHTTTPSCEQSRPITARTPQADTSPERPADTAWIRLSVNPRAFGRDLATLAKRVVGLKRFRYRPRCRADQIPGQSM